MENKLNELLDEFARKLTKAEENQYIPKLRDYLIPYILETKSTVTDIEKLFKYEFTLSDITNSTIHYITKNQNIKKKSAIDDFLIALNRLFDEVVNDKYSNQNLLSIQPFTSQASNIEKIANELGKDLGDKESFPRMTEEQFMFTLNYFKDETKNSFVFKEIKIIIYLMGLYGLNTRKIVSLIDKDFDEEKRTLRIIDETKVKRNIYLELPYNLSNMLIDYKKERQSYTNEYNNLFITREGTVIDNNFTSHQLNNVRDQFKKTKNIKSLKNNPFTPSGICKYSIIKMMLNNISNSIIMDITGFKGIIINECQEITNEITKNTKNRYINHKIRAIDTFDML